MYLPAANAQQDGWIAAAGGLVTKSWHGGLLAPWNWIPPWASIMDQGSRLPYVGQQEGKTVSSLDVVYSGDFSAADKGIEFAKAMIDQGADVFFGDASAVDSGARQAIDEANAASGSVSIYDIAQPSDLLARTSASSAAR